MGRLILLIVLLLAGTVSCTNLPPTNNNLFTPTPSSSSLYTSSSPSIPPMQVMTSTALTQEVVLTEKAFHYLDLEPGQYILYQTDKADKVSLSALSPYTGETYSLYNANYPSHFELSSSLRRLALVKEEQVELIDLETGSIKTVKFENVCSSAAWSPDASKLALACGDVFIVSFSDLSIFQLTDLFTTHRSEFGVVSWSPDGKWLAYNNVADPYGNDSYDGIYITDTTCFSAPDSCREQTKFFSGLLYQYVSSAWSSDSSKLAFLALGNIFILDVASMEIDFSIEAPHENPWNLTGLAWSPDGSQFAISNEIEQKIIVISSRNGEEAASFPIAGNVLFWIKVAWPFASGDAYQITPLGNDLNLREMPTLNSNVLTKLRRGDKIVILEGPKVGDGYTWWKIKTSNGIEGWIVDIPDWFEPEHN